MAFPVLSPSQEPGDIASRCEGGGRPGGGEGRGGGSSWPPCRRGSLPALDPGPVPPPRHCLPPPQPAALPSSLAPRLPSPCAVSGPVAWRAQTPGPQRGCPLPLAGTREVLKVKVLPWALLLPNHDRQIENQLSKCQRTTNQHAERGPRARCVIKQKAPFRNSSARWFHFIFVCVINKGS